MPGPGELRWYVNGPPPAAPPGPRPGCFPLQVCIKSYLSKTKVVLPRAHGPEPSFIPSVVLAPPRGGGSRSGTCLARFRPHQPIGIHEPFGHPLPCSCGVVAPVLFRVISKCMRSQPTSSCLAPALFAYGIPGSPDMSIFIFFPPEIFFLIPAPRWWWRSAILSHLCFFSIPWRFWPIFQWPIFQYDVLNKFSKWPAVSRRSPRC